MPTKIVFAPKMPDPIMETARAMLPEGFEMIETEHDDFRRTVQQTSEFVQRLEAQQQTQLIRIAQIQMEIDLLKRALRERGI